MKILITGSNGFIGKNVSLFLKRNGHEVFGFDLDNKQEELESHIKECDWLIHLAGINRPLSTEEFYEGNTNFTIKVVELVKKLNPNIKIIANSSSQAELDNDYGKSKKMAEDYLIASGLNVYIYRFYNVFGKWCRPNYNSACATFCYNIAHDLPVQVRDPNYVVHYNYVDDISEEFLKLINCEISRNCREILKIYPVFDCSLGKLVETLNYFKKEIESERHLPIIKDEFELKLFKTFCNYLSDEGYSFNYASDARGSFEELYKSKKWGQISDNVSFPGICKGGHYHTYKKEIFYTVVGKCHIRQRNIKNNEMIENIVSGDKPHPVNIIPYYTHEIKNIGDIDSHTIMWISEIYSDQTPDTFKEEVDKK